MKPLFWDVFAPEFRHLRSSASDIAICKNDEDIERDTEIFYLDDSIVGILRITQQFYTSINSSNKENKIEIINFALEEIESRVCDRIVINDEYESYAKKRIEELK